jgi:Txe/YoeB family toxin of Txe-Axe toxin-antitoxin module
MMFEDVNFWKQFNVDFIRVFKKYIDNIIKTGLAINNTPEQLRFTDCNCSSQSVNKTNEKMLRNLSESLGFIIDGDVNGHLNFISDSLYNWAEYLYEYMSWPIN